VTKNDDRAQIRALLAPYGLPAREVEAITTVEDARARATEERTRLVDAAPRPRKAKAAPEAFNARPPWEDVPHVAGTDASPGARATPSRSPMRRCRDVVDEILARKGEPWIDVALGAETLVTVRPGGIILLIGGTGRGKSSLAVTLLGEHARDRGPALACSLELPSDEWTARAVGVRVDASWPEVLRGEVPRNHMLDSLPDRLGIIEREHASLDAFATSIDELRAEYPDGPMLVAVDYVQLVDMSDEREIRARVGRVMRELDRIARARRVVVIALSQGSRAASRVLASGEAVGAATTDSGAESADLERWASVTLAIGALADHESGDGSLVGDLSIGKDRMGNGDRVVPARYYGRSGLWRTNGDSRSANEVRQERQAHRDDEKMRAAELAIAAGAAKSEKPITRQDLGAHAACHASIWRRAIANLLARGELVEVERRMERSRNWLVWTRERADAAGVPIVVPREVAP
jgi:hypothetical protein